MELQGCVVCRVLRGRRTHHTQQCTHIQLHTCTTRLTHARTHSQPTQHSATNRPAASDRGAQAQLVGEWGGAESWDDVRVLLGTSQNLLPLYLLPHCPTHTHTHAQHRQTRPRPHETLFILDYVRHCHWRYRTIHSGFMILHVNSVRSS